jgi:Bacterial Ig domain
MKKISRLFIGVLMFQVFALALCARAATVMVGDYALSPDPVYIRAGDVVYWDWDEGESILGPYYVDGPWGAAAVPCGVQFLKAGTYQYTAGSIDYGGTWSGTVVVLPPNSPPTVKITNPTNSAVLTAPATFSLEADASDPDPNDLSDVEFYVDDAWTDDIYSPPYTTTVQNLAVGTHTLTAIAWDMLGASATDSVTITVVNPGPVALTGCGMTNGNFMFSANGLGIGKTNVLEGSTNLVTWFPLQTNVCDTDCLTFTNSSTERCQFFRVRQLQ